MKLTVDWLDYLEQRVESEQHLTSDFHVESVQHLASVQHSEKSILQWEKGN
jgi:hypothetical protein